MADMLTGLQSLQANLPALAETTHQLGANLGANFATLQTAVGEILNQVSPAQALEHGQAFGQQLITQAGDVLLQATCIGREVVVGTDDTVSELIQEFSPNALIADVVKANNLDLNASGYPLIYPGQKLCIPVSQSAVNLVSQATALSTALPPPPTVEAIGYANPNSSPTPVLNYLKYLCGACIIGPLAGIGWGIINGRHKHSEF